MPRETDLQWNNLAQSLCFKDEKHMYDVLYYEMNLPISEISARLGVGSATINRRMSKYGLIKRGRGTGSRSSNKKAHLWLMDQRVVHGTTSKALADIFEISYALVYKYKLWKSGGDFDGMRLTSTGSTRAIQEFKA